MQPNAERIPLKLVDIIGKLVLVGVRPDNPAAEHASRLERRSAHP